MSSSSLQTLVFLRNAAANKTRTVLNQKPTLSRTQTVYSPQTLTRKHRLAEETPQDFTRLAMATTSCNLYRTLDSSPAQEFPHVKSLSRQRMDLADENARLKKRISDLEAENSRLLHVFDLAHERVPVAMLHE